MSASLPGNTNPSWRGGAVGYGGAHRRTVAQRGPASAQSCVSCGRAAAEWAYTHLDPREIVDPATGMTYSPDPAYYRPMCKSCHKRADCDHAGRARCGTDAGYFRHRRRGESTCADCRAAHTAASHRRLARIKPLGARP